MRVHIFILLLCAMLMTHFLKFLLHYINYIHINKLNYAANGQRCSRSGTRQTNSFKHILVMITKLQICLINQLTNNCPIVVTHAAISISLHGCGTCNCHNHGTLYTTTACHVTNVEQHINAGFSD